MFAFTDWIFGMSQRKTLKKKVMDLTAENMMLHKQIEELSRTKIPVGTSITTTCKWSGDAGKAITYYSEAPDETLEDIVHGFVTCLVGLTWSKKQIVQELKDYAEEQLEYDESSED